MPDSRPANTYRSHTWVSRPMALALPFSMVVVLLAAAGQHGLAEQEHPPCHDKESRCSTWAGSYQCQENPHYMLDSCTRSCQVAVQCSLPNKPPARWLGHATDHATRLFATMFPGASSAASAGLFRKDPSLGTLYKPGQKLRGDPWLYLSSLGVGTYLGTSSREDDLAATAAVVQSVARGWNVIDSASNYRDGHGEEVVGHALGLLRGYSGLTREMVFLSTKAGFLSQADVDGLLQSRAMDAGDLVQGTHCLHPACLDFSLKRSLARMNVGTVDLLYLHNAAEAQGAAGETELLHRLHDAFVWLEHARQDGSIRAYGMATWSCFREAPSNPGHLDLHKVVALAEQVGGLNHGFRYIQLPVNMGMPEAWQGTGHTWPSNAGGAPGNGSILEAAAHLGVGVFASAPLQEGQLLQDTSLRERLERELQLQHISEPAPKLLQMARSTLLVTAAIIGHKKASHVQANLEVGKSPIISPADWTEAVERLRVQSKQ